MLTTRMIGRWLGQIVNQPIRLKLYESLAPGNPEGQIVEVRGGGYSDRVLSRADWMILSEDPQLQPVAEAPVHQFIFDGTRRIVVQGMYLTQDIDGGILDIEPFAEPLEVLRKGDIIPVRATLRLNVLSK